MLLLALSTAGWSGLSAIGGALVGGAVTGRVTYKIEGNRQRFEERERTTDRERADALREQAREREEEALRRITLGAARLMRSRFYRAAYALKSSLDSGYWLPRETGLDDPVPIEERKLVAQATTRQEWKEVGDAEFTLLSVLAARDTAVEKHGSTPGAVPANEHAKALIGTSLSTIALGAMALDRLAEEETTSQFSALLSGTQPGT